MTDLQKKFLDEFAKAECDTAKALKASEVWETVLHSWIANYSEFNEAMIVIRNQKAEREKESKLTDLQRKYLTAYEECGGQDTARKKCGLAHREVIEWNSKCPEFRKGLVEASKRVWARLEASAPERKQKALALLRDNNMDVDCVLQRGFVSWQEWGRWVRFDQEFVAAVKRVEEELRGRRAEGKEKLLDAMRRYSLYAKECFATVGVTPTEFTGWMRGDPEFYAEVRKVEKEVCEEKVRRLKGEDSTDAANRRAYEFRLARGERLQEYMPDVDYTKPMGDELTEIDLHGTGVFVPKVEVDPALGVDTARSKSFREDIRAITKDEVRESQLGRTELRSKKMALPIRMPDELTSNEPTYPPATPQEVQNWYAATYGVPLACGSVSVDSAANVLAARNKQFLRNMNRIEDVLRAGHDAKTAATVADPVKEVTPEQLQKLGQLYAAASEAVPSKSDLTQALTSPTPELRKEMATRSSVEKWLGMGIISTEEASVLLTRIEADESRNA